MSPEPGSEPPLSPEAFQAFLRAALPSFGLKTSQAVASSLGVYLSELDHWRRRINLTGNLSAGELVDHALESLLAVDAIAHGARVIDVGSGAGFPGLPLSIARPDLEMTLVEPRAKKCAFLRHVARMLKLANVSVFEGRVEEVGGQTFDVATTRAVGHVAQIFGDAAFLERGGRLLTWTTSAEDLGTAAGPEFALGTVTPVPGSRVRVVCAYSKENLGNPGAVPR
jgi:16S rRNA (guanine527-N7)-methyltransferase